MIKIYAYKIKHQPKNMRQLSLESKHKSIMQSISQLIQY